MRLHERSSTLLRSATLGVLLSLVGLGHLRANPIVVSAVSGSHAVQAEQGVRMESECYNPQNKRITLRAARNEVVDCQLLLTAGANAADRVTLSVGQLANERNKLPTTSTRLSRAVSVRTGRAPSWLMLRPDASWPQVGSLDALVPLDAPRGGQPFSVSAGTTAVVWIDVAVDEAAEPGDYTADIEVRVDDSPAERVQLFVQVLPFALPACPSIALMTGVDVPSLFRAHLEREGKPYVPAGVIAGDPMAQQAAAVIDQTLRMLHRHRCNGYLVGVYPSVSLDASGRVKVVWDDYDRTVGAYLSGKAFSDTCRPTAWPMPVDSAFPPPASYGGVDSPAYGTAMLDYLRQCAEHWTEKGWFDRHFVWTRPPFLSWPESNEQAKALGTLTRRASSKLRFMTGAVPQSMKVFGWLGHEVDPSLEPLVAIWAPPAQFLDPETMARQRALGRTAWMTIGHPSFCPSLELGSPSVDPAALAWQAFRYGLEGIVVPIINDWAGDPLTAVTPVGAHWLIYPGKAFRLEGPIPSVRLKRLRRGLQDLEYLAILKQHNQGSMADTLAQILFRYGGTAAYEDHFADGCQWPWVEQPELWDQARRLMADRLAQVVGGAASGSQEQLSQTVEYRRLIDAACRPRVYCEGVRIRPVARSESEAGAEVEFHVVVRNERPEPLTGHLRFGKLPVGWTAAADNVAIHALAPMGRARLSLVARAAGIGTNEAGIGYVPIALDVGTERQVEILARLTEITPRRLERPIVLDGDLSDWPTGIRNVAGDFVLVCGQDPLLAGREPTGRAKQQTLVFAGFDRQRLYFAFNCREDHVDRLPNMSSNFVRYEGLLPADDDLLEILIDPTNAGTGQPMDVYHIVIRPTGATLVERGVNTETGWGTRRYWPAEVRVAPARQSRAWTVEVSIPLNAFEPAERNNKRWAINFARFQPRVGEYSSWSGARRYFYNTRSFGNLQWP